MNRIIFILPVVFIQIISCSNNYENLRDKYKLDSLNVPSDTNAFYFPTKFFINDSIGYEGMDTFLDKWYSNQLFAMREPLIYLPSKEYLEVYRLTWLRSFHKPMIFRIQKKLTNMN